MNKVDISEEVLTQILINQREILHGISCLLAPNCKGGCNDKNGETRCNVALINRFHETEQLLGLNWGEDLPFQNKN